MRKMQLPRYFTIISFFILVLITAGCSSVFYYPSSVDYVTIKQIPIKPKEIFVESTDNVKLRVWQFKTNARKISKAVILHFHGNAQNLTSHFVSLYPVLKDGYDLVEFDYRGYGKSSGHPDPKGLVKDGTTMIRWVKSNYPKTPIIIVGQSLGGAVAMRTLIDMHNEVSIRALVLDSTFSSYRSAARKVFSHSWITWLFQPVAWLVVDNSYAPKGELSLLGPYKKIVIHGTSDRVIDYDLGRSVFSELSEPKEFWRILDGQHTDFMWRDGGIYAQKLLAEFDKMVAP